jgi:hypothetical protein
MAMRTRGMAAIYFVGFHSRAIRSDTSDLAVTIFPVQAIPPSSRTDFGQVALSSQIRRSPFAGTIVLGPFLLSLGLRLGLQSNLPAGELESLVRRAVKSPRWGRRPGTHAVASPPVIPLDRRRGNSSGMREQENLLVPQ